MKMVKIEVPMNAVKEVHSFLALPSKARRLALQGKANIDHRAQIGLAREVENGMSYSEAGARYGLKSMQARRICHRFGVKSNHKAGGQRKGAGK